MQEEIINKVANSALITLDLEELYPTEKRVFLDIKQFLFDEQILKEKDFREQLKNYSWEKYTHTFVALGCSNDAIFPSWAYLLIAIHLQTYAKLVHLGSLDSLEDAIFTQIIAELKIEDYTNKKVILKGCSHKEIPENAYIQLVNKLKPVVSSLMFGEACSTVPLYKSPKV